MSNDKNQPSHHTYAGFSRWRALADSAAKAKLVIGQALHQFFFFPMQVLNGNLQVRHPRLDQRDVFSCNVFFLQLIRQIIQYVRKCTGVVEALHIHHGQFFFVVVALLRLLHHLNRHETLSRTQCVRQMTTDSFPHVYVGRCGVCSYLSYALRSRKRFVTVRMVKKSKDDDDRRGGYEDTYNIQLS
jgi:hypothetical protein